MTYEQPGFSPDELKKIMQRKAVPELGVFSHTLETQVPILAMPGRTEGFQKDELKNISERRIDVAAEFRETEIKNRRLPSDKVAAIEAAFGALEGVDMRQFFKETIR